MAIGGTFGASRLLSLAHCGRPVYFRNSLCLGCRAPLGYEPELLEVRALRPGPKPDTWKLRGKNRGRRLWRRCENFDSPAGCNWLVAAEDDDTLCLSCRLNRTIPDLGDADNCRWWRQIQRENGAIANEQSDSISALCFRDYLPRAVALGVDWMVVSQEAGHLGRGVA